MKKFTSVLLALCLCLSVCAVFAACSKTHEHSFATEWSKDATHHWHACTGEGCNDVADKAEHTWNAGEITTPATAAADGVKTFTCTACGATKTESVQLVTTVTKEQWDAFMANKNYTIIAELYDADGVLSETMSVIVTETATCSTFSGMSVYTSLQDGVWYGIMGEEGSYFGYPMEDYAEEITLGLNLLGEYSDFDLWTYDAEKKAYYKAGDAEDDFVAYLYFEDGVFSRLEAEEDGEKQIITVSEIGTTTVTLPEFEIYDFGDYE